MTKRLMEVAIRATEEDDLPQLYSLRRDKRLRGMQYRASWIDQFVPWLDVWEAGPEMLLRS